MDHDHAAPHHPLSLYLVEHGVDLPLRDEQHDAAYCLVYWSAKQDNENALKRLLEKKWVKDRINHVNEAGDSALILAIHAGNNKNVFALLQVPKIDCNIADAQGETPLMLAAKKGDVALIARLLEKKLIFPWRLSHR